MGRVLLARVVIVIVAAIAAVGCGPAPRRVITATATATAPAPTAAPVDPPPAPLPLEVLDQVLGKIRDEYVDATRVVPRTMLAGAVDGVQRDIAEVMAETRATGELEVQVNAAHQVFATADVDSVATLATRLGEILQFIHANLAPTAKPEAIVYAAINGMLATLDPHSTVFDPAGARDFRVMLSGTFGGLGVIIGVNKDATSGVRAVVVQALVAGDTPARAAGIQAGDRIVMIDDESTAAFSIDDAMDRLRGPADTAIVLAVQRAGVDGIKLYRLNRAVIKVSEVTSELLDRDVGYIKINAFTASVAADVERAVDALRARGARGWVLDLRGNSGGAMAQAVKVADLFVDHGTIVITEGAHSARQEDVAKPAASDDTQPLAVLVDSGTASAGEILAGALHDLDRALLLGARTFGKASVQVLFDLAGDALLKLTIAQYSTGETSLQSVGIVPDIELDPVQVPAKLAGAGDVIHLVPPAGFHESDLEGHLTSSRAVAGGKPVDALSYLAAPRRDEFAAFAPDFEITLARDVVAAAEAGATRPTLLRGSKKLIARARAAEQKKIAAALRVLGVEWKPGRRAKGAALDAVFSTDQPADTVAAGETVAITGVITNTGKAPVHQVRARATSDDDVLDGLELVFGRIDPGASKRVTVHVAIPPGAESRLDVVSWAIVHEHATAVTAPPLRLSIEGQARPQFAYSYRLREEPTGAADGVLRAGDRIKLAVTVTNTGPGKGPSTVVTLQSGSGPGLAIEGGRVEVGALDPGQHREVELGFRVRPEVTLDEVALTLAVFDEVLATGVSDKLTFAIGGAVAAPASVTPPELAIPAGPLETTDATWILAGTATDDTRIEDAYVLVTNHAAKIEQRKVLYVSNRAAGHDRTLALAGAIPLWPGSNVITVVVRENAQVRAQHTTRIYRAAPPSTAAARP